jgi:hypothetical protein
MAPHVRNQHCIELPVGADVALPFFTPLGEEYWVDGWQPRYLHPAGTKAAVPGMVFTTGAGDEFTIWTVLDYDRDGRRARYLRTTPAQRTGTVEVRVEPRGPAACEVQVEYAMTALHDADAALAPYRGERFVAMIEGWKVELLKALPRLLEARLG